MPATITQPEVYVNSVRLTNIAPGWGGLKVTHRWAGGCWEASWGVPVRGQRRARELQAYNKVVIYYGASPVWRGDLTEPNWDTGEMVAIGSSRQGEQALALGNGTGAVTAIPNLAIDQAYIRGAVDWNRRIDFGSLAFSDPSRSANPIYLNDLLNAKTKIDKQTWGVDPRGDLYLQNDPTIPRWVVSPDSGTLGVIGGGEARSVVARYLIDATTYANVKVGAGSPEIGVALDKLGVISSASAGAKAQSILDQLSVVRGWANGLALAATQINSIGGTPVNLASIRAGHLMRLQGLRDERSRSAVTDIILGETIWDVSEQIIQCNPVDMDSRDLGSIIEDAGGELLTGL